MSWHILTTCPPPPTHTNISHTHIFPTTYFSVTHLPDSMPYENKAFVSKRLSVIV